jgi:hypothetical protein
MNKVKNVRTVDKNKRDFIKKASYTAPAILTLSAVPAFASTGSGYVRENRNPARNN